MDRRKFVAATCCVLTGVGAGCLSGDEPEPLPRVAFVELENHRREESYEFAVRIEDGDDVVLDETYDLGPAGSGESAVALEDPVAEPGDYTVLVEVGEYAATAETAEMISGDDRCLGLRLYLGDTTLHLEHRSYQQCG